MTIPARYQPEVGIRRIGRRLRSLDVAALESNGIKQPRRKPASEPAQADSCFSFGLILIPSRSLGLSTPRKRGLQIAMQLAWAVNSRCLGSATLGWGCISTVRLFRHAARRRDDADPV